jgi:hypothetical protein
MYIKPKTILFFFLIAISHFALSQDDSIPKKNPFKDKFYTGGGFGFQFGDYTFVQVSPILGYYVNENLSVGIGAAYQYANSSFYNFSTHTYGGSVFGRYIIWRNIFAYTEYEFLNIDYAELLSNNKIRKQRMNISSFFVGGGYRQMIGEKSAMILMVLWNLDDSPYSPYVNPVLRIGLEIGL